MAAAANAQLVLTPDRPAKPLATALEINSDASLSFAAARADTAGFARAKSFSPDDGAPEAYWARVALQSVADVPTEWVLPLALHDVSAVLVREDGRMERHRTGRGVPLAERTFPVAQPVAIQVALGPRESAVLYLKVAEPRGSYATVSSPIPVEAKAFERSRRRSDLFQGLFAGVFLALAFYNLFLFWSFRDESFLYYVLFLLFSGLFWGVSTGHVFELFWPQTVAPYEALQFFALAGAAVMYIQFVRRFLDTRRTAPLPDQILRALLVLWVGCILLGALGVWNLAPDLAALTSIGILTTTFSAGIAAHRRGFAPARAYLFAAVAFLALGLAYIGLYLFSPTLQASIGRPMLQVSMLTEALLLALALSVRIRILTSDKAAADIAREKAEATAHALQETDALKTRLLGIAAHDLRSPLTGIVGFSEMIEIETPERPDVHDMTSAIRRGAQRMLHLIEDLLVTAALDGGRLRLNRRPTALAALVADVIDDYRSRADAKQQALSLHHEGGLALASVDPDRCRAIVENLVSNAIKYTPYGGTVRVELASGAEHVRIAVRDNGPGLSADDQNALFQRFRRLTPNPTGEEAASGLGLSIAQQLARLHGGRIEVESTLGEGSVFTFVLPKGEECPVAVAPEASCEPELQMA
ncbi:sensor histidine kinase [Rubricoccus marinus]|uniref:sensor histidine kinase n=1 Tax=Rubricoccus marinus TaxID=716817 RepID=UPI0015C60271|nr:sensor histidine kinase [Rubricoccus marinus]